MFWFYWPPLLLLFSLSAFITLSIFKVAWLSQTCWDSSSDGSYVSIEKWEKLSLIPVILSYLKLWAPLPADLWQPYRLKKIVCLNPFFSIYYNWIKILNIINVQEFLFIRVFISLAYTKPAQFIREKWYHKMKTPIGCVKWWISLEKPSKIVPSKLLFCCITRTISSVLESEAYFCG